MARKFRENEPFKVIAIKTKPRVEIEEALDKMYAKRETFYFELFSKIKRLADERISFEDTHVGNILPNPGSEIKLIDFDGATIEKTAEAALKKSLRSAYNWVHLKSYMALPNLSNESRELLGFMGVLNNLS